VSESWDQSGFDSALDRYMALSRHSRLEVINKKAYFVARKALWFTDKVDPSRIRSELGRLVTVRSVTATGRTVRTRSLELAPAREHEGISLARMILIARYRRQGGGWPTDQAGWWEGEPGWDAAIRNLIASRERSSAFIKSGWLPAIRFLAGFVPNKSGQPAIDNEARIYGDAKGSAVAAAEANQGVAWIINSAFARHDTKTPSALERVGSKALDLAFYDETQDLLQEINRRLSELAVKANAEMN
jgi:hypothetical protein